LVGAGILTITRVVTSLDGLDGLRTAGFLAAAFFFGAGILFAAWSLFAAGFRRAGLFRAFREAALFITLRGAFAFARLAGGRLALKCLARGFLAFGTGRLALPALRAGRLGCFLFAAGAFLLAGGWAFLRRLIPGAFPFPGLAPAPRVALPAFFFMKYNCPR